MRRIVVLDVREILVNKGEPFHVIMASVESLGSDDIFELHATFEPTPLIRLLSNRGFHHAVRTLAADHVVTQFAREKRHLPYWYLDNRGLEPPQPMLRTLALLDEEPQFQTGTMGLEIWNDRVPVFLLPEIEARGLTYEIVESDDGARVKLYKSANSLP
ncbi:DUF2249 domain-containing protein [Alicyclobacillus mali]|uniref:DUF2249 domain-containing protein n=1 Tax=Alicyclobacillus mali (ex Roth et al. 2021) TaxID=1123961 RepID=A0ABS0F752_9BACL|nr:DUF2249 domain-containing protein [Alicyclobacillus mali (ex Roth et al. 2021)]MCL6489171.1 DUF2249 domain-containing protein [Alicyclobacillus mali (ex Roth et al. 2021)]